MKDAILTGSGNSRFLKSNIPTSTTWEQALALLRNGSFPIDLNGINASGFVQQGTPLNKSTILTDALAARLELDTNATLVDFLTALMDRLDTAWTDLATASGLTQGVSTGELIGRTGLAYRVENGNHVFVRANVSGVSSSATYFTINNTETGRLDPELCISAGRVYHVCACQGGTLRCYATTDGDIVVESVNTGGATTTLSWTDIQLDWFV